MKRDYKKEYARRIERGLKAGKSRSAARGHPRAKDLGKAPLKPPDRSSPLEQALRSMKSGSSQKAAAAAHGVKPEQLRRYINQQTTAEYRGGRWVIFDLRPQSIWLATRGQLKPVTLAMDDVSEVGRYWAAISKFLDTNNVRHLEPFAGKGVRDVNGTYHPFEVRPNMLRKLDSIGDLDFIEIYANTAS